MNLDGPPQHRQPPSPTPMRWFRSLRLTRTFASCLLGADIEAAQLFRPLLGARRLWRKAETQFAG